MRKWYLPVTVLGLGGVSALLLSERGREWIRWVMEGFRRAPATLQDWNDNAQVELERIQAALNRIAESLESPGQLEH